MNNFKGFYKIARARQGVHNFFTGISHVKSKTNLKDSHKTSDTLVDQRRFYKKFPNGIASIDSILLTSVEDIRRICNKMDILFILTTHPESIDFQKKLKNSQKVLDLIITEQHIHLDCRNLFHHDLLDSHHIHTRKNENFSKYLCNKITKILNY